MGFCKVFFKPFQPQVYPFGAYPLKNSPNFPTHPLLFMTQLVYNYPMQILGYAKRQTEDPKLRPYGALDYLLFAYVAYARFDFLHPYFPLTFEEASSHKEFKMKATYEDCFTQRSLKSLFFALASSPRYKQAKLIAYHAESDNDKALQFAALAIELEDELLICFRGTSPAYIGWKEDFALSYQEDIASYYKAEEFLDYATSLCQKPLVLAGHSKGGHVAAYCLIKSKHANRIKSAYSFEGPGFRNKSIIEGLLRDPRYMKIIPNSSFVGILLSNEEKVKIVRSVNIGPFQHDPFSWQVKGNDFFYVSKRSQTSKRMDLAINNWIYSLSKEERQRFTEILFGALDKLKARDFLAFFRTLPANIGPLYQEYRGLSNEDKTVFSKVVKRLVKNLMSPPKEKKN